MGVDKTTLHEINKPTATDTNRSDFSMEDIVAVLLKWKWVVLFFSLTIPIISLLAMLLVEPEYQSDTIISVKSLTPESRTLGETLTNMGESLNSLNEELFLKSSMVLGDVVRELNLNIQFTKEDKFIDLALGIIRGRQIRQDYRDVVSRIHFNPPALNEGVYIDFYAYDKYFVTSVDGGIQLGSGIINEVFSSDSATFLIEDFPHKVQDRFLLVYSSVDDIASYLANGITVKSLTTSSEAISAPSRGLSLQISTAANSPRDSIVLANTIATIYLKRKLEEAGETITQVLRFINEQMDDLRVRTEESIQNVEGYKQEEGLYFVEESAKTKLNSILELDLESNSMDLQVSLLQNLFDNIKRGGELTSKQIMLISSTDARVAADIGKNINDLQLERIALARKFTPLHPEMLANEGKINGARKMLLEALESQIEILREKVNTNRSVVERNTIELSKLNEGLRNLNRLQRVSDINERLLTYLMRRKEETKIQRASIIANVKILRPASSAMLTKPQKDRYVVSGILAGILVGVGISFLLESMDNTVKSPAWIEKELGVPVYGMIPHFYRESGPSKPIPTFRDRTINLIMMQDPKSMIAEAYRALRTNIQFANMEKKTKVFLFTSPAPREGKSTTIANLAVTMANMGTKVLVMDCDLRKPIIHRFFNFQKETGITDILTRGLDFKEAIKKTDIENCFILTSGKSPPNPSELLGGSAMKILLNKLKENFDIILIDTSPIIPVTDALVLAPEADSVFLILEIRRTTTPAAITSINALRAVHVAPAGAIINNLRPEDRRSYGYSYGYGYGYGYGGRYRYGGYGYKYYRYYDYHSYYTTEDEDEKTQKKDGAFKGFLDRLLGRQDDSDSESDT